jgi:stearoyl-CoA desaturase (Delta-9 desaturase)
MVVHSAVFFSFYSGFGVTGGAHRLWAHRSYQARWPLRLLLAAGHTISLQVRRVVFLFYKKQF